MQNQIPRDLKAGNGLPTRYLRTPEAARFLGVSPRTLEKHRCYGTGPEFLKLGGRVVYQIDDLTAWAARGRRSSTFQEGAGTVLPARRFTEAEIAEAARQHRLAGTRR